MKTEIDRLKKLICSDYVLEREKAMLVAAAIGSNDFVPLLRQVCLKRDLYDDLDEGQRERDIRFVSLALLGDSVFKSLWESFPQNIHLTRVLYGKRIVIHLPKIKSVWDFLENSYNNTSAGALLTPNYLFVFIALFRIGLERIELFDYNISGNSIAPPSPTFHSLKKFWIKHFRNKWIATLKMNIDYGKNAGTIDDEAVIQVSNGDYSMREQALADVVDRIAQGKKIYSETLVNLCLLFPKLWHQNELV